MQRIIYYVAVSVDGFIEGPNQDISMFMPSGAGVDKYLEDLQSYKTVIMGRSTYEFGYQYGLQPGQPAYPHMDHYIFSSQLKFKEQHEKVHVNPISVDMIQKIRDNSPTDIYMCGGGKFAGWLLENGLIDQLKIKLNPVIIGSGTPLFEGVKRPYQLKLTDSVTYPEGLQVMNYEVIY